MMLSKPMIEVFAEIARGNNTLKSLANTQQKSVNWITEILQELEKEDFILKKKNYALKRSRIIIEVANTNHAIKLKEILFQYPTIKFKDILSDSKLLFLAALSEDWISTEIAARLGKISRYTIDRCRPMLKKRGIIIQKEGLYKVNEKAWHLLREFLIAYKNYAIINGYVKWKYQDETIFEVDSKSLVRGSLSGFAKYHDYGINLNNISFVCKIPESNLSKEEIFTHSLFEVNDPRTIYLALTFYLKNKLNYKKVLPIAMKYGKYTLFCNLIKLLKVQESKTRLEGLPEFDKKEFNRIAGMYGVKNV